MVQCGAVEVISGSGTEDDLYEKEMLQSFHGHRVQGTLKWAVNF